MSDREPGEPAGVEFECIVPILRVTSLAASVRYYREVLGFRLDWGDPEATDTASVSRSGHAIMLCQGGQGQRGTWIWIGVEDIDPLFTEYRRKGARFLHGPADRPWAYEMQVIDPDGHVLRFGSEPRDAPSSLGGP
jgi:catechol 2,3-dioxygenase-like lactoylglutathione lyase family enzyme